MFSQEVATNDTIVLCTDLDRTLIPNGLQPESPSARKVFSQLVARPEIVLVYVTGRDRHLVRESMAGYQLPVPDFVVADVGTSIYRITGDQWQLLQGWHEKIGEDWHGYHWRKLAAEIGAIDELELQSESKQNDFKLSYQISPASQLDGVLPLLRSRLKQLDIHYNCIDSVDETQDQALVDILPQSAGKRLAIDFLMDYLKVTAEQLFFSGDSGNDFDVLISPYRSTLVGNATDDVKSKAIEACQAAKVIDSLYIARGLSEQLNGNYAAGILEGFLHFYPQARNWITLP